MRLSSAPSTSPFQQLLLKRNPVASVAAVLACTCLLLIPLVAGVKEPEIDLKTANHDHIQDHTATMAEKYARAFEHSQDHEFQILRKNKPHKSYAKKYVDGNVEKKSIYDKKYFDYLPVEQKGPLETSAADASLTKRTNSRRLRRDTDAVSEHPRGKRQGYTYQIFSPVPTIIQPGGIQFDPYHRPQLHNQYLPPRPNLVPNRMYLPSQPAAEPGMFDISDRFGGNRVFAFDTIYDRSVDTNYILYPGSRPSIGGGQFPNSFQGPPAPRPVPTTPRPVLPASRPGSPALRPTMTTTVRPLSPATTGSTSSTITTTTPRPVIQNNSDDDYDWASLGLSPDAVGSRLGGDNGNKNDNSLNPQGRAAPSKCTWAIANCCSQYSDNIRYYCFEQNQCYGAFWGDNVCRTYYKLALTEIENYYNV